jgi:putative spermidine/putrescine transport system permease protein
MRLAAWIRTIYVLLVLSFILSPLAIIVVVSFSPDDFVSFPPPGFSLRWYARLLQDRGTLVAFWLSARLGLAAALLAMVVALPTAQLLARHRSRLLAPLRALTLSPLILPEMLLGLSLLQFATNSLRGPTFWLLLIGHAIVVLPFSLQVVTAALARLNRETEEAAMTLGATPLRTYWRVTLPGIGGGIASGLLLSFVFSFDNIAISIFLAGPGLTTLPVKIYEHATYSSDPLLAAISAALIYLGILVMLLMGRMRGFVPTADAR